MAAYFLDTSALLKRYHPEAGTQRVDRIFQESNRQVSISRLTAVEITSASSIKVRTGSIKREDANLAVRSFRADISAATFNVIQLSQTEFGLAEWLIDKYAFDRKLRTLDALQLAVAISLRRRNLVDRFVAADKILCDVARREGFSILNPEES